MRANTTYLSRIHPIKSFKLTICQINIHAFFFGCLKAPRQQMYIYLDLSKLSQRQHTRSVLSPLSSSYLYLNPVSSSCPSHLTPSFVAPCSSHPPTHSLAHTHPSQPPEHHAGIFFYPLPSWCNVPWARREWCQRFLRPNAHRWTRAVVYPCIFTYLRLSWRMFRLSVVTWYSIYLNTSILFYFVANISYLFKAL